MNCLSLFSPHVLFLKDGNDEALDGTQILYMWHDGAILELPGPSKTRKYKFGNLGSAIQRAELN
jgi:hypothetical protein